jgi:lysophospholipase L1-like esterase
MSFSAREWSALSLALAVVLAGCSEGEDPADGGGGDAGSAGAGSGGTPSAGTGNRGGAAGSGGSAVNGGVAGTAAGTGGSSSGNTGQAGSAGSLAQGGGPSGGMAGTGPAAGEGGAGTGAGGTGATAGTGGSGGVAGTGGSGGVAPVIAAGVRWVGRVDVSDPAAPAFAWSGTGFAATVAGEEIAIKLRSEGGSDPIFFQAVIDGVPQARFSVATSEGEKTVTLGGGLGAGEHAVQLFRETEGKAEFAYSTFLGFSSGTPAAPPPFSGRLIEIIGDSISAGYGNLGSEEHPNGSEDPDGGCRFSTETESAYLTYGAVAARALDADASIVAASGWGIYSDNGGNTGNVLPALFSNTVGARSSPAWSFAAEPQAVVINLGTNDFSANMALGEAAFSDAYRDFLGTVRAKYPAALILCAIGPLLYGTGLTNATAYINALVAEVNQGGDQNVKVLDFGQQNASLGTGCDWHPNVAENQRMADRLVTELEQALGW